MCVGVLTGLSMSPVSRLKHTWSKLTAKQTEVRFLMMPESPFGSRCDAI